MEQAILKQIRWLKLYATLSTVAFTVLLVTAFTRSGRSERFNEIDVERINIVEKDGTLKMVISNQARQHPGIVDGKVVAARKREAGIIFFNTDGDECGGLVYEGDKKEAGLFLSVDQYKNDQVMQLQYSEALEKQHRVRSYGLKLWDRPEEFTLGRLLQRIDSLEKLHDKASYQQGIADMKAKHLFGEERLFLGKNRLEETGLFIRDRMGNPRIKLYVDKKGEARIEMLNGAGKAMPLR